MDRHTGGVFTSTAGSFSVLYLKDMKDETSLSDYFHQIEQLRDLFQESFLELNVGKNLRTNMWQEQSEQYTKSNLFVSKKLK